MNNNQIFNRNKFINIKGELLDLSAPKIMGILNLTNDSFYDGGKFNSQSKLFAQVEKMLLEGADIIDLGAQSTRPGAILYDSQFESDKLLPIIKHIKTNFPDTVLSIDTFYPEVARRCLDAGADLINDVSGGQFDQTMFDVIIEYKAPYILMHSQGNPQTMQQNPSYQNLVSEMIKYFADRIELLNINGVSDIIIDPGFGFGKTIDHNYQILNALSHFSFLERPILVGLSRKSMIYKVLDSNPEQALNGTSALNMLALLNGANILRVHDVLQACELVKLFSKIQLNKVD